MKFRQKESARQRVQVKEQFFILTWSRTISKVNGFRIAKGDAID
jgi:hypothetical protein